MLRRQQAIIWTNDGPVNWLIYASLGLNELKAMRFHLRLTKLCSWVTHICVGKLTNIGSDNGLSPGRRQAIIWTNAGTLLIGPLGTYLSEIWIEILTFSFKKMHLKMSCAKWRPFCLRLNELKLGVYSDRYNLSRSGMFRKEPFENWSLSGSGPSPNRGYPAKRAQSAMRKHGG